MDAGTMENKAALLADWRAGKRGGAVLRRLDACVAGPLARTAEDIELLLAHAELAWIADQRDPTATRALTSARRLVELVPELPEGYRCLGLAALSRRDYREAFLAFSAGLALSPPAPLETFRALARLLMTGIPKVGFEVGGQKYAFDLTTHNAAAIESSAFHASGMLTEWEELKFLGALLEPTKPRRIAEVGVLLGNHTAFFLKTFQPAHLTLVEADPANLPFIEHAIAYNATPRPEVVMHNAFAGAEEGEITFAGAKVPVRPLDGLIEGPLDFLKIDVDGGEENVLKGAARLIEGARPVVMIETTPATDGAVAAWFAARGYKQRRAFDHGAYRNVVYTPWRPRNCARRSRKPSMCTPSADT